MRAGGGHCIGATLHWPVPAPARIDCTVLLLPGWSGPRTGPAELLTFLARRLSAAQAHFRKLHAAGCAGEARFEVIAGANHNFYRLDWREELAALVNGFVTGPRAQG